MVRLCLSYFGALLVMLCLDAIWLATTVPRLYHPLMGRLLAEQVWLPPAVLFYLLYVAGIVVLAILPSRDGKQAMWRGASLGVIAYGTYDLTNQATIENWPVVITLADMAWGMVLTCLCAFAGFQAGRRR